PNKLFDFGQLDIKQSDIEQSDIEQSDIEYNSLVVFEEHALKKKWNCEINSKMILEKLANHPDVLEVLGPLYVQYKHCKKLIKLKRNYNKTQIESHVSNSKCVKNKGFQDLKKFFLASNPQDKLLHKRYLCSGLCEEKHLKYIERVGRFITFGGAPPINKVAKELFSLRFPNKAKFSYSKLTTDQSRRLNDELSARSKWKIDQECLCVCKLWTSISYTNETNTIPFWVKLAKKGLNRAFKSKSTFQGLCELMIQIAHCKEHKKGVQNLKYSEDFTHFMAILSSISPKAYDFY
ncbi:21124_t:CDS:2, partial [Gigaspora margarita]